MPTLVLAFEPELDGPFLALPVHVPLVELPELALLFSDECAGAMGQVIFEEPVEIKVLTVQFPVSFLLVIDYLPLEIGVDGHGHGLEWLYVLLIVLAQLLDILGEVRFADFFEYEVAVDEVVFHLRGAGLALAHCSVQYKLSYNEH